MMEGYNYNGRREQEEWIEKSYGIDADKFDLLMILNDTHLLTHEEINQRIPLVLSNGYNLYSLKEERFLRMFFDQVDKQEYAVSVVKK